jgi:putative oxidoreductase
MIETLLQTNADYVSTFLRIIAGMAIFPYGMQKLFGWFDSSGIKKTLKQLTLKKIPTFIAWLVILGQSFGSIALLTGFSGRIAAGGLFIIFTGEPLAALDKHR